MTIGALLTGAVNLDVYVSHMSNPDKTNKIETTSLARGIKMEIGGGASITALALAKLGLLSAVAGAIGEDSDIILRKLAEPNVQTFLKYYPHGEPAVTIAEHY